ncbi:MAG: hypothetical protein QOD96_7756 [Pseudonocardiales bacterium]|nr:hypothetical protein [Pseudonocardiales bacterium]
MSLRRESPHPGQVAPTGGRGGALGARGSRAAVTGSPRALTPEPVLDVFLHEPAVPADLQRGQRLVGATRVVVHGRSRDSEQACHLLGGQKRPRQVDALRARWMVLIDVHTSGDGRIAAVGCWTAKTRDLRGASYPPSGREQNLSAATPLAGATLGAGGSDRMSRWSPAPVGGVRCAWGERRS